MTNAEEITWTHSANFSGVYGNLPSGGVRLGKDKDGNIHVKVDGETPQAQLESFIQQMEVLFTQLKSTMRHDTANP